MQRGGLLNKICHPERRGSFASERSPQWRGPAVMYFKLENEVRMKRALTIFGLAMFLTACSNNAHNADLAHQGITVCGTVSDDNHQPVANAFVELHHSAKDPTVMQTRYQVDEQTARASSKFRESHKANTGWRSFPRDHAIPSQKMKTNRAAFRSMSNGTPGPQCKTQWQVVQDASCKVTVQ